MQMSNKCKRKGIIVLIIDLNDHIQDFLFRKGIHGIYNVWQAHTKI
jgi:hypothetical protein